MCVGWFVAVCFCWLVFVFLGFVGLLLLVCFRLFVSVGLFAFVCVNLLVCVGWLFLCDFGWLGFVC